MKLTAVISKGEEFYIGQIKELPGVLTQGASIEEAKRNLMDALQLWLEEAENEEDQGELEVVYKQDLPIDVY